MYSTIKLNQILDINVAKSDLLQITPGFITELVGKISWRSSHYGEEKELSKVLRDIIKQHSCAKSYRIIAKNLNILVSTAG